MILVEVLYAISAIFLSIYGLNNLVLTWLYLRHRKDEVLIPDPPDEWPFVTVQLPIYNEMHIVTRLVETSATLDYPRDRLEIQVLDDSDDGTRDIAVQAIDAARLMGVDIVHIARAERSGFKAGALSEGLSTSRGEFVAVFDADFVAPPDFLKRVIPQFHDSSVGCVQARWGHLNRDYSALTQVQALGIDGHFVVEQAARSRAGLFLNFNGTAGVWRKAAIDDAGGWQGDTLTEDLDLSYRAQLKGWRFAYLPDVVVPAEIPAQISAFKRQQARWAQGSIQTALKMLRPLLMSDASLSVKLEGIIHLTNYLVHPLMLLVVLLTLPMSVSRGWILRTTPWLMLAAVGPPLMYTVSQIADGRVALTRLRYLPVLVMLGMGLALTNTVAVLKALLGVRQKFLRTPKFALRHSEDMWQGSLYALRKDWLRWGELALMVYSLVLIALPVVNNTFAPWLLVYAGGFGFVSSVSFLQSYQIHRWRATHSRPEGST